MSPNSLILGCVWFTKP